jgi:hypothetical protein
MTFLKKMLITLLAVASGLPATAQFSTETMQQMQNDQINAVVQSNVLGQVVETNKNQSDASPAQLPVGWTVAATQGGMATLAIAGSDDAALIGVLAGRDPAKILTAIAAQQSPKYKIVQAAPVSTAANGYLQGGAALQFADGRAAWKMVVAHAQPNGTVAVAALITTDLKNPQGLKEKAAALGSIMRQLVAGRTVPGSKALPGPKSRAPVTAVAASAGPVVSGGHPAPPGIAMDSIGGTFVPGKYVGKAFYKKQGSQAAEDMQDMTLYLFDNGEYATYREPDYGRPYTTDAGTGHLDLAFGQSISLYNSDINPGEDVCFYGIYQGVPAIYGRSDRGFSNYYVMLVRQGPPGRLSPAQAQEKAAADDAEAKRYKFVTAWGKGAGIGSVAAVAHSSQMKTFYNGALNTSQTFETYVLFKDGTFHEDFPIPLEVWDTATAKRRDAKRWGRWRQAGGGNYLLTFSDGKTTSFSGEATRPARNGETLSGQYGNGSASGSLMSSSYSLRYITFRGNRFEIDESGGTGSSTFSQSVPGAVAINTTTSNGDTFTSVTGENVVVGAGRKGKERARTGSYQLGGYTLRLQFDDGRVTVQPFFFIGGTDVIWYNDETRAKE